MEAQEACVSFGAPGFENIKEGKRVRLKEKRHTRGVTSDVSLMLKACIALTTHPPAPIMQSQKNIAYGVPAVCAPTKFHWL